MSCREYQAFTRREFLHNGLVLASAAVTVPWFLQSTGAALAAPDGAATSSRPGVPEDRILVVVQLAGGNDGLNTVVPYGDSRYYAARPGIGIAAKDVLKLGTDEGLGLHPRLAGLKDLYDNGMLAIVQGVGYPNPNRSHFSSTDIWSTAETDGIGAGWLGKYFDNQCHGSPAADAAAAGQRTAPHSAGNGQPCKGHAAVAIGRTAPLALQGHKFRPVSFENTDLFRWTGLDLHKSMARPYQEIAKLEASKAEGANPNAAFLMRTSLDAQIASERIRAAVANKPGVNYPGHALARQLSMVASMIRAGLETRVYYVSMGGFDTHAGQGGVNGSHANLLTQLAESLRAFYNDLKSQGNDGRVLTMTFSEFGRRVGQNGSNGTDHGTAAPMFLAGPMVKAGVHGAHPSLSDLDQGDLKFHTDFRAVYSAILAGWLRSDPEKVLGGRFQAPAVLKA
ncbi:MAG: DUF1501 domain-containing protein [Phycisphaerales bacterium]|nr:DUF1501 domain-containing protein [Phycisphaerales bacterium]